MESFNEKIERLIYTLPYNSILAIKDSNLREILLKRYAEEQAHLFQAYPGFEDYFDYEESLEYNYYNIEQSASSLISEYLFSGDKVIYFPITESFKASKKHICAISGNVINPGSYYEQFKAILYNCSQNKSYVSKKIRYITGEDFKIPTDLHEFEELCYYLDHAYELSLEYYYNITSNIRGMSLQRIKYKNQKKSK